MREGENLKIGDLIKLWQRQSGLEPGLIEVRVQNAWQAVLGEEIARETTEFKLKNRVLYIKIESSALRQDLSYSSEKLVNHLNEHLDGKFIDSIRFR